MLVNLDKKVCGKCLIEKELNEFGSDKPKKDGKSTYCKLCNTERTKQWQSLNNEKVKEVNNNWRKDNPNYNKTWQEYNADSVNEKVKKWRRDNPEYCRNYNRRIAYIIAWRRVLTSTLARLGKTKEARTIDLLGYSAIDLKLHIEKLFTDGMSWDNYGEWHIDHIKLVSSFDKETSMNVVNSLSNLRPLWATTREINGVIYEGNLNRKKF